MPPSSTLSHSTSTSCGPLSASTLGFFGFAGGPVAVAFAVLDHSPQPAAFRPRTWNPYSVPRSRPEIVMSRLLEALRVLGSLPPSRRISYLSTEEPPSFGLLQLTEIFSEPASPAVAETPPTLSGR